LRMEVKFNPCKKCGSLKIETIATIKANGYSHLYIRCLNCGYSVECENFLTALKRWNERNEQAGSKKNY